MITTDHKVIGNLYFITSMAFFLFGGILAWRSRELAFPACSTSRTRPTTRSSHARHDHAVVVRDAVVCRIRQRDHAAADRRADVAFRD
jgi:hypothetical protein